MREQRETDVLQRLRAGDMRGDFPIFAEHPGLVYLDTGASAQTPAAVIDAMRRFYESGYANIHRGVYELSEEATRLYEEARAKVARLLGAPSADEIVFLRGATEAMNLLAHSFARPRLQAGDEILITHMEHHANIVPWQLLCEEYGVKLVVAPVTDEGELDLEAFGALLGERTKIVSVMHVSNVLGTVNPVRRITEMAHAAGAHVIVDGAQAVPHQAVDVREIGCDFYVFSGHKLYGPTGIGALWGRADLLAEMPPWQGGGDMIRDVSFEWTTFAEPPARFEAGTPHIAGAVGLGAAIDYLHDLGFDALAAHEEELRAHGAARLAEVPGLRVIGTAAEKAAVFSFTLDGVHPHDIGTFLGGEGIAVRAGHHCAQPLMDRFGVPATTRASLGLYNTTGDIDRLVAGLHDIRKFFGS